MTRTWDDAGAAAVLADTCPVCASEQIAQSERDWFVLELERGDEVRREAGDVEFACRSCGSRWG